jgi:hypothetical protein
MCLFKRDLLGGDDYFAITIRYSIPQRLGTESSKDGRVDSSNPGTSEESSSRLPRHGEAEYQRHSLFLSPIQSAVLSQPPMVVLPHEVHSLDRNRITLLHTPRFQDICNFTSLLHQFPKRDFSRFGRFISFVDDGRLVGVGVVVSVETVVCCV